MSNCNERKIIQILDLFSIFFFIVCYPLTFDKNPCLHLSWFRGKTRHAMILPSTLSHNYSNDKFCRKPTNRQTVVICVCNWQQFAADIVFLCLYKIRRCRSATTSIECIYSNFILFRTLIKYIYISRTLFYLQDWLIVNNFNFFNFWLPIFLQRLHNTESRALFVVYVITYATE